MLILQQKRNTTLNIKKQPTQSHAKPMCCVLSCVWLCNPTDRSTPGSPVLGILQARILEWVAISFSYQTHRHPQNHYWTLHCTPERIDPAIPTITQTRVLTARKPWQATGPTLPTESRLHKKEPQHSSLQKVHPKQQSKQNEKSEKYSAGKRTW